MYNKIGKHTNIISYSFRRKPIYEVIKRGLDIFSSAFLLIALLLPMIFIAVLVKCDSQGPALYCQERLGIHGRSFVLWKFRTMVPEAEKSGAKWADAADPRRTGIGVFLRRTHLDELPQLWNILRGEMSFVGPRPERECFYGEFEKYIAGFSRRLAVKPGLTGLAQVRGGYDLFPSEKLIYDLEYIGCRSFSLDLFCLLKTIPKLFTGEGAR